MSLLNRLERRLGRWAIPNLTMVLVVGQAVLYVATLLLQDVSLDRVTLDPARIMQGEVWRLATFLFVPPPIGPLFVIFYFILLHLFGTTLERHWGEFRFNVYVFIGYLANVIAAFVASAMLGAVAVDAPAGTAMFASVAAPNQFLYGSLFLAFARLYPDFTLNLFFILPIRIKWLALLAWAGYGYAMVRGGLPTQLIVLATVLNYLLFFGREHWHALRHGQRRRSFRSSAAKAAKPPKHACRVCGKSTDDSPRTLFRYCSKCVGQCCYCPEHIRDHEHVTAEEPAAP